MKYLIALLLATCLLSTQALELSQSEIDSVEQLLAQLKGATQTEINDLEEDYQRSRDAKLAIIAALYQSVKNQNAECNARDQDVKDRESDIVKTQNYIDWLQQRVVANNARVATLRENSCHQNDVYVSSLKNQKISLRLIIFLREALQNSNDKDFSLAQQNQMGKFVLQFLSIYRHGKGSELQALAKEIQKTFHVNLESEEGPATVFTQQEVVVEKLDVTISGTKSELIEILNRIEADVRRAMVNSQELSIRLNSLLADFLAQIFIENTTLNKIEGDEERNLESLHNQLITALQASALCKDRLAQLQLTLQGTQTDLDSATDLYNSQHTRLEAELALFDDVYRIYAKEVSTSDDRFKQRVDTYVKNKGFSQQTEHTSMQGSMEQAVMEQIAIEDQV